MPRQIRQITSGRTYEVDFRAKAGLPFPPNETMHAIIGGIMARSQREHKVTICHYVWMSNHVHFILIAKDTNDFINFYTEVERKLTEAIKSLLGLRSLNLWEGTPTVSLLPDVDTIKNRIAYIYANPAQADIEDSIELHPGLNTWGDYVRSFDNVEAEWTVSVPWIRTAKMKVLPSPALTRQQDKFFAK